MPGLSVLSSILSRPHICCVKGASHFHGTGGRWSLRVDPFKAPGGSAKNACLIAYTAAIETRVCDWSLVHAYSEACFDYVCLILFLVVVTCSLAHPMHMIAGPHPGYQTALPVAQLGSVRRAEIAAAKSGPWPLQSIRNGVSKKVYWASSVIKWRR